MINMIMHGCNGAMGQVITGLAKDDEEIEIVAGIDIRTEQLSTYPVFTSLEACTEKADVIVDFASAKAVESLLEYSAAHRIPVVLCTTGLTEEQLKKVEEASRHTAILRSANMLSLIHISDEPVAPSD